MESLDNGKPIRESRDIDIPLAIRHFYHHAGHAQLMPSALSDRVALGVCGQIIPWNFPLLMLAWKIAPALAMGNTVVLKPAEYTPMTAMIFADLCSQAGVPPGVVNIVTGDGSTGAALVDATVDKIAFTGSTSVGRQIQEATAGSGKSLTLELGGKSPYIVFDDADIDSAIEGLVDAIWFNQGQVCCAGSRLLIHEAIADDFHNRLKTRMDKLRIGDPLDKSIDVGAIVDPIQLRQIRELVEGSTAGQTYHAQTPVPEGCFYPPTLITGLHPADRLMQEEIFGPYWSQPPFAPRRRLWKLPITPNTAWQRRSGRKTSILRSRSRPSSSPVWSGSMQQIYLTLRPGLAARAKVDLAVKAAGKVYKPIASQPNPWPNQPNHSVHRARRRCRGYRPNRETLYRRQTSPTRWGL
jgi:aldehyde dehydrogenase (NAD+)